MFFENIKEAIISILSNKMRSLLTMLGIIIGISSVIIITTIGGSIQSYPDRDNEFPRRQHSFRHMWRRAIRRTMQTGIPGIYPDMNTE